MNGLRNWLQLNKDVTLLQSKLKGTLPTRNNVMGFLRTIVIESSLKQKQTSTTTKQKSTATGLCDTDHVQVKTGKNSILHGQKLPYSRCHVGCNMNNTG